MSEIISIEGTERKIKNHFDKTVYYITHLTVDDGTECEFYHKVESDKPEVGEKVKVFLDSRYNKVKAERLYGRAKG